ncbi:uncharacterized protein B0H18DRAFT_411712 [Fomitopsis serialis]|uniref:uncharacterized protein n=1 Tax=Fomitopsis serialis TaxID=139415 RepID=UPI002007C9D5|nr:uncharacterized protein B0H18DRAFT_411712 [Neoantrodia serialis]KAH9935371.1 hypothetical protein B0H18DRAFT_411712 [Neoantrodia serialis]
MSSPTVNLFPAPMGGVPLHIDIAPALFFDILYGFILALVAYRFISKSSRTLVILGTIIFTCERIVDFSVRTSEAYNSDLRTPKTYVNFLQGGYAIGIVGMTQDVGTLIMVFLVNSTRGNDALPLAAKGLPPADAQTASDAERAELLQPKLYGHGSSLSMSQCALEVSQTEVLPDEPRRRHWIRMFCLAQLVLRLTAMAMGAVSSGYYYAGEMSHYDAMLVQHSRYLSAGIALFLLQGSNLLVLWGLVTRPTRVALIPALYLSALCCILSITPIYRLVVMANYTDSLLAMGPGSHNGTAAKVLFYCLQITPETIALLMLLVVNVKKMFGIHGGLADMAFTDPKSR